MIVYVVYVENENSYCGHDFYVKFVVDSPEKARKKCEEIIERLIRRTDYLWENVKDYGDMLIVADNGHYYIVAYEAKEVG